MDLRWLSIPLVGITIGLGYFVGAVRFHSHHFAVHAFLCLLSFYSLFYKITKKDFLFYWCRSIVKVFATFLPPQSFR